MTDEAQRGSEWRPAPNSTADAQRKRGRLSIFLGMASGAGKTFAMLQAAQHEKFAGRDVVIGWVDSPGWAETRLLAEALPAVARKSGGPPGEAPAEMDSAAIRSRRPQLVVVDDLARRNAAGSHHAKRFQDVQELLEAGIEVYTTLNIGEISSRADTARQIMERAIGGAKVPDNLRGEHQIPVETVPDSVLDEAEIKLIDLPPAKLLARLPAADPRAQDHSLEVRLMALRELALRFVAERAGQAVNRELQARQIPGSWKSGHRLLVAVGPGGGSQEVVRWTRRLADSLNASWLAVHVELPRPLAEAAQSRLALNLGLARELGAEVVATTDNDVVRGLLRIARQRNITQIVAGKSSRPASRRLGFSRTILHRLIDESGDIEVQAVPAGGEAQLKPSERWGRSGGSSLAQYLVAGGVVLAVTLVTFLIGPVLGVHPSALIFLFAVVLLGLFVGRGPTLMAATMSALLWDYLILPPVFDFRIPHLEDRMLFGMYFVVALVLGQLTARIRAQEAAERQREGRAVALYLLTRELAGSTDLDQMLQTVVQQMETVFQARIVLFLAKRLTSEPHPASTLDVSEKERAVANWVLEHGRPAGRFTDNLRAADALYIPLASSGGILGVMGLVFSQTEPPTIHQRNLLEAFSQQIGLALDRYRLHQFSEQARLLAESERLSKTLLNSVSHEIRTPIAAIQSATSNLAEFQETALSEPQRAMVAEIQEATGRLNRLVGNVLDITRLESGHVKPKLNLCDVSDLINVALKETKPQLAGHRVSLDLAPGLPLVCLDFVLMQQALSNLLSNAASHTPEGTEVRVSARVQDSVLAIAVADQGPGLPKESIPRLFDKFYRGPAARTGGTGLGLSLVKGFVEAQGGQVRAENRAEGGAVFTLRLPLPTPASPGAAA